MSKGNPPIKKFKLRRVEVAVWAKEDKDDGFVRYSLTISKSYKDKTTGEWVNSTFLFPEEAAVAAALIPQALGWIAEQVDYLARERSASTAIYGTAPDGSKVWTSEEEKPVEKPF